VTPRMKISQDLMMYLRFASGYRPGGPNLVTSNTLPAQYDPDKTLNYEIGLKGDFLEHTLSVDTSLYYIDWKNIQLSLYENGNSFMANGSSAKSQGAELSVRSRPLSGMTIAGWLDWNDAVLTEPFPPVTISNTAYGAAGDRLPYSSRFSGNISMQQEFPLPGGLTGFVGSSVSYVGDRLGVFTGTATRQNMPGYSKIDLRTGVNYESWKVNIFVNNLSDQRGMLGGGLGNFNPVAFQFIQPRTIGASLSWTF
jgi:iron complex outermembrane recepter protein